MIRDPLRYVRNPSQLESDQTALTAVEKNRKESCGSAKTERVKSRAGFDKRLLKDERGDEQSFEEARAQSQCFQIAPPSENFNILHQSKVPRSEKKDTSQMDFGEESSVDDISMAENASASQRIPESDENPRKIAKIQSTASSSGRVLFKHEVSFDASLNRTAISNASSVVNESDGVGLPTRREEETINTKLAMKELSMMFLSPALEVPHRARNQPFSSGDDRSEASDDNIADLVGNITLNNSIIGSEETENQISIPRNPNARQTTTPGFQQMVLKEIEASDDGGSELSCQVQRRRVLQQTAVQSNPFSGIGGEFSEDPGFKIFEDEDSKPAAKELNSTIEREAIVDENLEKSSLNCLLRDSTESNQNESAKGDRRNLLSGSNDEFNSCEVEKAHATFGFSIYLDDESHLSHGIEKPHSVSSKASASDGFMIYQDECEGSDVS